MVPVGGSPLWQAKRKTTKGDPFILPTKFVSLPERCLQNTLRYNYNLPTSPDTSGKTPPTIKGDGPSGNVAFGYCGAGSKTWNRRL